MTAKVLEAPDRIFLNVGDLSDIDDPALFKNLDEVKWCGERIDEHDIEYVRADLLSASIADTAGAKPIYQERATLISSTWFDVSITEYRERLDTDGPEWGRIGHVSAPPAPSSDTAGAKRDEEILDIAESIIQMDKRTHSFELTQEQLIEIVRLAAPPAPSVADAQTCAQAVLDLRDMLLRLIKYEGMANDDTTNKMYQKTTDALFAASRIREGSSSVADASVRTLVHQIVALEPLKHTDNMENAVRILSRALFAKESGK